MSIGQRWPEAEMPKCEVVFARALILCTSSILVQGTIKTFGSLVDLDGSGSDKKNFTAVLEVW